MPPRPRLPRRRSSPGRGGPLAAPTAPHHPPPATKRARRGGGIAHTCACTSAGVAAPGRTRSVEQEQEQECALAHKKTRQGQGQEWPPPKKPRLGVDVLAWRGGGKDEAVPEGRPGRGMLALALGLGGSPHGGLSGLHVAAGARSPRARGQLAALLAATAREDEAGARRGAGHDHEQQAGAWVTWRTETPRRRRLGYFKQRAAAVGVAVAVGAPHDEKGKLCAGAIACA